MTLRNCTVTRIKKFIIKEIMVVVIRSCNLSAVIINRMSSKNICSGWRRAANVKCPLLMNIESL
jgi:hypothetical protein